MLKFFFLLLLDEINLLLHENSDDSSSSKSIKEKVKQSILHLKLLIFNFKFVTNFSKLNNFNFQVFMA